MCVYIYIYSCSDERVKALLVNGGRNIVGWSKKSDAAPFPRASWSGSIKA